MSAALAPGLRHRLAIAIDERLTVPGVFPDDPQFAAMPPVFATAYMVGFMEMACIDALRGRLGPDQFTVGTHVDVSHCAATPVGFTVTAEVELEAIEGRRLWFKVRAHDGADLIGEGRHQRAIVDRGRFDMMLARKSALRLAS